MKYGVVCDRLQCDVQGCPYRWQGETNKEADRVPLRYTSVCREARKDVQDD